MNIAISKMLVTVNSNNVRVIKVMIFRDCLFELAKSCKHPQY